MDDEQRYSLCPACSHCPEVVIGKDGVTIGEDDNLVRLSPAEWNVLVEGVKSGALGEADTLLQCGGVLAAGQSLRSSG